MSLLELKELAFSYGEKQIFSHVNYALEPGQLCCLMGPNGCGKSTLLDCILGCLHPQAGEVFLNGKNIRSYHPNELAKWMSYVPQVHDRTFPYTVRQIVEMGRTPYHKFYSGPDAEDQRLVTEALELAGIRHLADRPYTRISGGEMQLALLARAIVQDTPLILMDEPTAHLDFRNELVFLQMVSRLMEEKHTAVLLATHSPNHPFYFENLGRNVEVAAMGDKTLKMVGKPQEVLTEENIQEIYGICARRMSCFDERGGTMTQIFPVCTCTEEKKL